MSLAVAYKENKNVINTAGITVYLLALGVAAVLGTNYMYEVYYAQYDMGDFVLEIQITVIVSLMLFVGQLWLRILKPNVSLKLTSTLKNIAYLSAALIPVMYAAFVAISEAQISFSKGNGYDAVFMVGVLILALFLIFKLYKVSSRISALLCETAFVALACFSPVLIVASLFIVAIGMGIGMLVILILLLPLLLSILRSAI